MLIRKKSLKIQERLGMNIGVTYGVSTIPVAKSIDQTMVVLRELYKIGFKALVLPRELFSGIKGMTELYKDYYGDLLRLKNIAKKFNIELSLHISNLTDVPDEQLRLFSTIASVMDCRVLTIHPTFYARMPQDQALRLVVYKINEIVNELRVKASIGVETTGRLGELGSIEDVIDICKRTRNTEPVINWAHVHARGAGFLKSQEDFKKVIEQVRQGVGQQWLRDAYFFFSGIKYGPSGEIAHTSFLNSDLKLEHLIRSILSFGMRGTLIFEEQEREKDVVSILDRVGDMVR
jgi:deoxyribonuclease-4